MADTQQCADVSERDAHIVELLRSDALRPHGARLELGRLALELNGLGHLGGEVVLVGDVDVLIVGRDLDEVSGHGVELRVVPSLCAVADLRHLDDPPSIGLLDLRSIFGHYFHHPFPSSDSHRR